METINNNQGFNLGDFHEWSILNLRSKLVPPMDITFYEYKETMWVVIEAIE
jgi:hypothetical protein